MKPTSNYNGKGLLLQKPISKNNKSSQDLSGGDDEILPMDRKGRSRINGHMERTLARKTPKLKNVYLFFRN